MENSSRIVVEFGCGIDAAGDRASLINFVHHVEGSVHWSVLIHSVNWVGLLREAALSWHAVPAPDKVAALEPIGPALGLIDAASFFCDIVLVHELVGQQLISAVAPLVSLLRIAGEQ